MTQANINTAAYWNDRFLSGHWEEVGGRAQTRDFAEAQLRAIGLPRSFSGSLLDFGCGLGDAFPVYRKAFPDARLIGMDVSSAAIDKCNERFPRLAQFLQGDHTMVPPVDVIVASNVLEHLSNDIEVATSLRSRCKALHIIVPFREDPRIDEHVHTYDRRYFRALGRPRERVYASRGWSQYGRRALWLDIYLKNLVRPLIGRPRVRRRMQIIYSFRDEDAGRHVGGRRTP